MQGHTWFPSSNLSIEFATQVQLNRANSEHCETPCRRKRLASQYGDACLRARLLRLLLVVVVVACVPRLFTFGCMSLAHTLPQTTERAETCFENNSAVKGRASFEVMIMVSGSRCCNPSCRSTTHLSFNVIDFCSTNVFLFFFFINFSIDLFRMLNLVEYFERRFKSRGQLLSLNFKMYDRFH